jgi:hypothetical protein
MSESVCPPASTGIANERRSDTPSRRQPISIVVALAAGAGLFLAWQTAGTLLLIFGGLLFASNSQFETMLPDVMAFEIRILASSIEKQLVLDVFMQI